MQTRRPTQNDVARLAGVTRGTVSLVLSGRAESNVPISDETRERVIKAAQELGYAPNPVAQMLARGSNAIIGVFTYEPGFPLEHEDHHNPYLLGIEREATRRDYDVLLFTRGRNTPQYSIYKDGANSLRLADGSVLLGLHPDRSELRALAQEGYPFVYIGRREVAGCEIDWVVSDYSSGGLQATRHVLELGHTRLAFVDHHADTEASRDKLGGCKRAVGTSGAELHIVDAATFAAGRAVAQTLERGVTAYLARDMFVMRDLLAQLSAAGLRVPDDVSVLSLGGGSPSLLPGIRPSRVRINREQVGTLAVQVLINRIRAKLPEPQHILVPCEFIAGETTAAPKAGGAATKEEAPEA